MVVCRPSRFLHDTLEATVSTPLAWWIFCAYASHLHPPAVVLGCQYGSEDGYPIRTQAPGCQLYVMVDCSRLTLLITPLRSLSLDPFLSSFLLDPEAECDSLSSYPPPLKAAIRGNCASVGIDGDRRWKRVLWDEKCERWQRISISRDGDWGYTEESIIGTLRKTDGSSGSC